jgi:hypothetical protein
MGQFRSVDCSVLFVARRRTIIAHLGIGHKQTDRVPIVPIKPIAQELRSGYGDNAIVPRYAALF